MEVSFASYVEAFMASNKPPRYGSRPFEQLSSIWDLCYVVPTHVCSFAPQLAEFGFAAVRATEPGSEPTQTQTGVETKRPGARHLVCCLLLLGGGPVVYKSNRQATVALSSAEAEYIALALATQEVLWLRNVLAEMGFSAEGPTTLQMDNKSAIAWLRTKGTRRDLSTHFVRDHIEAGRIKLEYVPTEHQLADFQTKAVPAPRLVQLCKASGIFDVQVEGE
ncbi:unnamed protein product [Phytophthora fragariaefolia]|uniref:Unnamed protein product n=1 Tax=Phytophthora fragariaefolia TaxID=1490495 RepID=A0A9W6UFF0_9STRA|nr:unnamed protein product [Phytophthora fragariaefolia]